MSEPIIDEVRDVLNRGELRHKLPGIELASIARAGAIRRFPLVPTASSHGPGTLLSMAIARVRTDLNEPPPSCTVLVWDGLERDGWPHCESVH